MAKLISSDKQRKMVRLSSNDIISIVQDYQVLTKGSREYEDVFDKLSNFVLYLPLD